MQKTSLDCATIALKVLKTSIKYQKFRERHCNNINQLESDSSENDRNGEFNTLQLFVLFLFVTPAQCSVRCSVALYCRRLCSTQRRRPGVCSKTEGHLQRGHCSDEVDTVTTLRDAFKKKKRQKE